MKFPQLTGHQVMAKQRSGIQSSIPGSETSGRMAVASSGRALIESEFRFRAAANLMAGYVYEARILDRDSGRHEIIWASDGFDAIFGRSLDEYNREQHWRKFYHPDELAAAQRRTAALMRGEPVESDVRVMRPDGSYRWLRIANRPVINAADGAVTGVLGLGMDITQRKLADQAVNKSELILRSLTSNAPDWLMLLDRELGVQFLNRSFLERAPVDWQGLDPFAAFEERQRLRARTVLRGVLQTQMPATLEVRLGTEEDGIHFEVSGAPVLEEGIVSGVAVRISDITERRRVANTLRTHATILQTMREGVLMFDLKGQIRFFNPAANQMFGFDAEEFSRLNVVQLGINMQTVTEATGSQELQCVRRDSSQFTAAFIFNGIALQDCTMYIGVVKDMTHLKRLERQLVDISSREQQRIASDLHDGLGQDLTGVALLLRSLADRIGREFPDGKVAVEEVIGMVNGAIQNTRLLARGLSPVEVERGGLSTALSLLAARSRDVHGVRVHFRHRSQHPVGVDTATADHLFRIAQEALTNALRHSGAKSIAIHLSSGKGAVTVSVVDDGCGIRPSVRAADSCMGMRIMNYRAQMIGARLCVEPGPGGGTRVRCEWKSQAHLPLN